MSAARSGAPFSSSFARNFALVAALALMMIASSAVANAIIIVAIPPNFYSFTGVPTVATGGPITNPGVFVTLNPQPLPPFPNPSMVDLTNPTDPMISEGGAGGFQVDFAIFLGNGPNPGPLMLFPTQDTTAPGMFHWTAGFADGSVRLFDVFMNLSAPGPLTVNGYTGGTLNGLPAVQINFDVQGVADPSVSFQVFDIGTQNAYSFTQTPEPGSLMLLGAGLAGLGLLTRKLRR